MVGAGREGTSEACILVPVWDIGLDFPSFVVRPFAGLPAEGDEGDVLLSVALQGPEVGSQLATLHEMECELHEMEGCTVVMVFW